MKFTVHHVYHLAPAAMRAINRLTNIGAIIMVTTKQVLDIARNLRDKIDNEVAPAVDAILPAVQEVGAAVDVIEKKITEHASNGGITPEAQADLEEAFAVLTGAVTKVSDVTTAANTAATAAKAVSADAADGIDEAAQQQTESMLTKTPLALDPVKNPHP